MHIGTTIIQNCWQEAELRPLFGWVEKHPKYTPNTAGAHATQEGMPQRQLLTGELQDARSMFSCVHKNASVTFRGRAAARADALSRELGPDVKPISARFLFE